VTITVVPPADIVFSGQARSAASFLDSIAINTHMGYANTLYLDANLVERSLSYLGIKYVRDGVPPYAMKIPRYQGGLRLAADGYKINYVMGTADPAALNTLDRVAKAYPSSTASVEGRNEVNCWRGLWNNGLGLPGILQDQKALEAAIHGDSYLKGVPVLNLTLCYPSKALYSSLGNMTGAADAGSAHIYAPYGQPPFYDWNGIYAVSAIPTPGLPMVITETGYTTLTSATSSVDEAVQAKYTLDIYADAAKSGAQRTYLYELLDLLPDLDYQHHFGLFRNDGTPKPAAVAVHNLTTILADTVAPQGPTGSLTYTVSNVPQQGNTFLLQKDSGAYDIVVWNEPQLWNYRTKQESPAPAAQSVVTLPSTYQTVKVFDPLQSSDPVQTLSNVSQVTVVVQGSPVIIEIEPNTTADITPPSLPTNLTAVTGATSAALSWSASGDNVGVVGYRVYRNTMLVGTTTVPSYLDSGLMPNTLYGYSIIAYDAAGNTSYPATYSLYTPLK
jgi:hypothetical protein